MQFVKHDLSVVRPFSLTGLGQNRGRVLIHSRGSRLRHSGFTRKDHRMNVKEQAEKVVGYFD